MHGNFFKYKPQFKLVVVGNHRPALRSVDASIRRRFYLVPFNITIPAEERDQDLAEKLKQEWPGILAWAIEGCLAWQRGGLNPPGIVRAETDNYFGEEDALGRWIEERCIMDPQETTSSKMLFASWCDWTASVAEFTGSQKRFGQMLGAREGIRPSRTSLVRGYQGIRLRTSTDTYESPSSDANEVSAENYQ
jgi:putative DNA primase/helicase